MHLQPLTEWSMNRSGLNRSHQLNTPKSGAVIGLTGLCGGQGHYGVAKAHRYATAATLGPFLYQQILYMTLLGWLVFAQVPDALVIAGAAVVVASGLYLLRLEIMSR